MNIVELTKDTFEAEVQQANVPVIVDFWAVWCGPCRAQGPILEQLAQELGDKIKICKVNVDEQPELAVRFQVASIPTLLFVQPGKPAKTLIGLHTKEQILEALQA